MQADAAIKRVIVPRIPAVRSLRVQIVVLFLITVVVILNVASWFFYSRTRDYFDTELGATLIGVGQSAADFMDADLLTFLKPGYENGAFYKELQENLDILKRDFHIARIFVVSSSLTILVDTERNSHIGLSPLHLQINLPEVRAALLGKATYSTLYRSQDGRLYKSAYAPVRDKAGEVVAVVCVDASPAFLQVIDRIEKLIVTLNILSILAAVVISLVLARSISRPVHLLVEAARRVSGGDFSRPVRIAARNEIGFLAEVFNSMQENIKLNEQNLRRLRQMAEGKAESLQAYNNYILRSIEHGIVACDLSGTVTIMNPAATRILDLSGEATTGRKISDVFGTSHPFAAFAKRALAAIPRQNRKEMSLNSGKGETVVSAEVSPLLDLKGEKIGVNFVLTDLTEIRKLQDKVREKERLAYLGELSATIAHEVRNPLNSMELFVGLLKRRIDDAGEREEAIDKIQREIRGLNTFISEFLVYARPAELKAGSVSISRLFQEVAFLALKELQDKHIDVRVNLNDQKMKISGDFDQLKRALLNVTLNAIQAMESEGTLTLAASYATVKRRKRVQLEVADTGSGIEADAFERVFEPFYSTRSHGTGLGLAIVRKIVEAHGGTVFVKKNSPKGTQFIFVFDQPGKKSR